MDIYIYHTIIHLFLSKKNYKVISFQRKYKTSCLKLSSSLSEGGMGLSQAVLDLSARSSGLSMADISLTEAGLGLSKAGLGIWTNGQILRFPMCSTRLAPALGLAWYRNQLTRLQVT